MAYDHFQNSVQLVHAQALTTAGVIAAGRWSPGYQPAVIRAVAITITTAMSHAGEVTVRHRPTPGSATGQATIATVELSDDLEPGDVAYVDGLEYRVMPGAEVVFDVTDATPTGGAGHLSLFYQPSWEHPSNNDAMVDGS